MTTFELARKLGFVETIAVDKKSTIKHNRQQFDYLFVLDFESTCWEAHDANKGPPEIIEFSVVLYDMKLNKIIKEFKQYVLPMETSKLSDFCKQLTKITQEQVDQGIPLNTCLMLFKQWIDEQTTKFNIRFCSLTQNSLFKNAVFVTWSDWDLNICLHNECKRKRINKPEFFNKWIDLRALYREHYQRKPKGLNGALTEVGLTFVGNEHCGLHDARNTVSLASRMISDGILLRITKDIS